MNRGAIFGSLAVASLLLACGSTDVELGSRPQFSQGGNVLTVLAFNGVTGEAVTGLTVTVRVGSHVLPATAASNAYTISNLPNGSWPIFIQGTGFLAFQGMTANLTGNTPANPVYHTATVAMYADTQVPTAYTIKVYDDTTGLAVQGGRVVLTLSTDASTDVVAGLADRIPGDYGYRPAAKAYDLAAGVATVPAADLIFGATYTIDVVGATNNAGKYLQQKYVSGITPDTINPPNSFLIQEVFMTVADKAPVLLTASTEGTPKPVRGNADAKLTLTFAQPVEDCTASNVHDFFTSSPDLGNVITTGRNVDMVPSDGGLTMTLTIPSNTTVWSAVPTATTAAGLTVTYTDFKVRVVGTVGDATCVALSALELRGATQPAGMLTVNVFPTIP